MLGDSFKSLGREFQNAGPEYMKDFFANKVRVKGK